MVVVLPLLNLISLVLLLVHAHCGIFSLVVKGLGIGGLRVRGIMN